MIPGNKPIWWPNADRILTIVLAIFPLFFGLVWIWTFGFTPYRSHLEFIGLPLGVAAFCTGIGMIAMRPWALFISVLFSVFATVAAIWIASISSLWFYWIAAVFGIIYTVSISRRLFTAYKASA